MHTIFDLCSEGESFHECVYVYSAVSVSKWAQTPIPQAVSAKGLAAS